MEHRWGERSKLNIPVQIDCGSRGMLLGVMRDASASGAFVCTAAQLPLFTAVRVTVGARTRVGHDPIEAHVVRRAADGFGLEWTELAPAIIVDLLSVSPTAALSPPQRIRPPGEPATPAVSPARSPGVDAVLKDRAAG